MQVRFTCAPEHQKLILNDPPMKIDDFGISRDVQTPLRRLRKQVLTDFLCILQAFGASCKGFVSDLAQVISFERPPPPNATDFGRGGEP